MRLLLLIALPISSLVPAFASAQPVADYPSREVHIVMPSLIGGTNDLIARALAKQLTQAFKKPVTVENRVGAAGQIGTAYAAKAQPDGYTLLVGNMDALAAGLSLQTKLPYNTLTDFAPVSLLADIPIVLAAHLSVPATSVSELIALAKARSGGLNAALPGVGTLEQLLTELFRRRTAIDIEVVSYKNSGRALVDLISGQADMVFIVLPAVREFLKAGRIKAIAVAGESRLGLLPDVPTMGEAGYPGIVAASWSAVLVPAATPREIVIRLNAHITRIMRAPEMTQYVGSKGATALSSTPQEARTFIRREIDKWSTVAKEAGIKPE